MNKMYALTFICICALCLTGCSSLTLGQSQLSTSDKEGIGTDLLTMVVPYNSGGGTDVFGRYMSNPLASHIESKPSIQVENIPGGGSITGANEYITSYDRDGSNLITTSASTHIPLLLGQSSVKYNFEDLNPIIGAPTGAVVYVSDSLGIESASDLNELDEKLYFAGMSPTGLDLTTLISFEVLGMDAKAVLGYEGRGPARVAFEQGESNIDFQTTTAYKRNIEPRVEEGSAVPLYSLGQIDEKGNVVRDPQFPDLPTVKEAYEDLYGKEPSGEDWNAYKHFLNATYTLQKVIWVHEDAPESTKKELEEAADRLKSDEDFLKESAEILEDYELYTNEELKQRITSLEENTTPEMIDWIYDFLLHEHGVDVKKL